MYQGLSEGADESQEPFLWFGALYVWSETFPEWLMMVDLLISRPSRTGDVEEGIPFDYMHKTIFTRKIAIWIKDFKYSQQHTEADKDMLLYIFTYQRRT
jgi:hypothetical protein